MNNQSVTQTFGITRHEMAKQPTSTALRQGAQALAKYHGIEIEKDGPSLIVWPPKNFKAQDPFGADHYAESWKDVYVRTSTYVALQRNPTPGKAFVLILTQDQAECIEWHLRDTQTITNNIKNKIELKHLVKQATTRVQQMAHELANARAITIEPDNQLDQEILKDTIQSSTWLTHHPDDAAKRTYTQCRRAIAEALNIKPTSISPRLP